MTAKARFWPWLSCQSPLNFSTYSTQRVLHISRFVHVFFFIIARATTPTLLSGPLSSAYGIYKTVKARFWPWLSGPPVVPASPASACSLVVFYSLANGLPVTAIPRAGDGRVLTILAKQFIYLTRETRAAVERIRHIQDSQGQIMALAFRLKSLKSLKLFPLRSDNKASDFFPGTSRVVPTGSGNMKTFLFGVSGI